jgi:hypothetical protein
MAEDRAYWLYRDHVRVTYDGQPVATRTPAEAMAIAQRVLQGETPDPLRGLTVEEARAESHRLAAKAEELTAHLARYHYADTSVIRANLERERNDLEWEAWDWAARVAEASGSRDGLPSARVVPWEGVPAACPCPMCEPAKGLHCPRCCDQGQPF